MKIETMGHQADVLFEQRGFFHHLREGFSQLTTVPYSRGISKIFGNCYTLNSAAVSNETLIVNKAGKSEALMLQLYAEHSDYLLLDYTSAGFLMDVHRFNTSDRIDSTGTVLPTGYLMLVSLKKVVYTRLEPPYGKCSNEYSRSFEDMYNFTYTVQACNQSCESYQIAENCKCYKGREVNYHTREQVETLPACNETNGSHDRICMEEVFTEIYEKKTKKCSCPLPCHEVSYDFDATFAPMTYEQCWQHHVWSICRRENAELQCSTLKNMTKAEKRDYISDNLAAVLFYFKDLTYQAYTEQVTYERSQFISDFGGNLGLWLGASIFTVLEIVELVTKITCTSALNKKNKQRRRGKPHNTDNDVMNEDEQGMPLEDTKA